MTIMSGGNVVYVVTSNRIAAISYNKIHLSSKRWESNNLRIPKLTRIWDNKIILNFVDACCYLRTFAATGI
jgi:hypothetical protein